MDHRFLRVAAAVLALAIVAPDVEAAEQRKRKSFFDNLFGTREERAARRAEAQRRKVAKKQSNNWWEDDQPRIIKLAKKRRGYEEFYVDQDYSDPEPIAGFGLGNIAFVLPRLPIVFDKSFAKLTAPDVAADSVRLVLSDAASPVKAEAIVRETVLAHYSATQFKPIWLDKGEVSPRAKAVMGQLQAAANEGLDPTHYYPAGIKSFDDIDQQIEGSNLAAAQFDVGLTVAVLTYARHMSGGAYDPAKLSLYHDIKPEYADVKIALKVLAYTPYPAQFLNSLMPTHPAYEILKQELLESATEPAIEIFPTGKRVKIGQKDERIPALRERLAKEGFAVIEPPKFDQEEVMDKFISKSLKAYQAASNIPQTGHLDQLTVKSFNGNDDGPDREKIISSLERIRWLPKNLGQRHVFVNQAGFDVAVMDQGERVWTSKVIVGKPNTQTNVFSDEMETVVFNPTWGMPQSILVNEYLGKLRRDPGYFDRIGYSVVNANGKKVSSRSVNWGAVGANSGIGVVQPAGGANALGEIKFLFPNAHSIYMHDTPNRNLFDEQVRLFSHGCVRVQNPREFAKVLLGLDDAEIEERIAKGSTQNVKIGKATKVHLTYFTAWPDETGKVRYYSDHYQRDETLLRARNIVAKAYNKLSTVKIVEAVTAPAQIID